MVKAGQSCRCYKEQWSLNSAAQTRRACTRNEISNQICLLNTSNFSPDSEITFANVNWAKRQSFYELQANSLRSMLVNLVPFAISCHRGTCNRSVALSFSLCLAPANNTSRQESANHPCRYSVPSIEFHIGVTRPDADL